MRITIEQYNDAKQKVEKLAEKLKTTRKVIDGWDEAAKIYGKPREGDEIVAFIVSDGGIVDAMTRKNGVVKEPPKRSADPKGEVP